MLFHKRRIQLQIYLLQIKAKRKMKVQKIKLDLLVSSLYLELFGLSRGILDLIDRIVTLLPLVTASVVGLSQDMRAGNKPVGILKFYRKIITIDGEHRILLFHWVVFNKSD